jgi:hypothetical protein
MDGERGEVKTMPELKKTTQMMSWALPSVVQEVEPEAALLLRAHGGKIARFAPQGLYYDESFSWEEHTLLSWPPRTILVYISPENQEDTRVLFAVFLLPDIIQELHLLYDYRLSMVSGSIEEYFLLHVPAQREALFPHRMIQVASFSARKEKSA